METANKYYTSINELPLSKFKEVEIKKNYYALVIEGSPDLDSLKSAWLDIVDEYNERMQDSASRIHINLLKEVELLGIKLQKIEVCLQVLDIEIRFPYVPKQQKFKDKLNEMVESKFAFNHSKPDEFNAELKRARNRSKSILINYELKSNNLNALNDKNGQIKKPTMEYYDSILNELSLFAKYEIQESITVSRFCDYVLKYLKHIKYLESQSNNNGKRTN